MAQRGIRDERVLAAVAAVPRELFVPENLRRHAYADRALPIGCGQTISQPFMVATMLEALGLQGGRALEIGTGSGYQAAPDSLYEQLAPGGRLVVPVGTQRDQWLEIVERTPAGPVRVRTVPCRFVPLIGSEGFDDPEVG